MKEKFAEIKEIKYPVLIFIGLMLLGVILGSFCAVYLPQNQRDVLESYVLDNIYSADKYDTAQIESKERIGRYFLNDLKLYAIMAALAFTVVAPYGCGLVILYQGFTIGFTSALLLQLTMAKGMLFILLAVMPQNAIRMAIIMFLSIFIVKFSSVRKQSTPQASKANTMKLLTIVAICLILNLIVNFIEAYVTPGIVTALKGYLIR